MNDFEIDQPRAAGIFVVNHIGHRRVTVRPGAIEFITPHSMARRNSAPAASSMPGVSVPRFMCSQRLSPGSFIEADRALVRGKNTKAITVEHAKNNLLPNVSIR